MTNDYLGIDIGATKTHFCVTKGAKITREEIIPSASWRQRNWKQDAKTLATIINERFSDPSILAIGIGAHGCDTEQECIDLQNDLQSLLPKPLRVCNDAELLLYSLGFNDGMSVISGTGSIAVTRNDQNQLRVSGGYGWMLGEEGGSAGLVREAARLCNLEHSRTGQYDPILTPMLEENFGTLPQKFNRFLMQCETSAKIGEFANIVFEAEKMGSKLAKRAITTGAQNLVELVKWLDQRVPGKEVVVYGGGMISSQIVLENLVEEIFSQKFNDRLQFQIYKDAPVIGACKIAEKIYKEAKSS